MSLRNTATSIAQSMLGLVAPTQETITSIQIKKEIIESDPKYTAQQKNKDDKVMKIAMPQKRKKEDNGMAVQAVMENEKKKQRQSQLNFTPKTTKNTDRSQKRDIIESNKDTKVNETETRTHSTNANHTTEADTHHDTTAKAVEANKKKDADKDITKLPKKATKETTQEPNKMQNTTNKTQKHSATTTNPKAKQTTRCSHHPKPIQNQGL